MGASEGPTVAGSETHGAAWQLGVEAYLDRVDDVEEEVSASPDATELYLREIGFSPLLTAAE